MIRIVAAQLLNVNAHPFGYSPHLGFLLQRTRSMLPAMADLEEIAVTW